MFLCFPHVTMFIPVHNRLWSVKLPWIRNPDRCLLVICGQTFWGFKWNNIHSKSACVPLPSATSTAYPSVVECSLHVLYQAHPNASECTSTCTQVQWSRVQLQVDYIRSGILIKGEYLLANFLTRDWWHVLFPLRFSIRNKLYFIVPISLIRVRSAELGFSMVASAQILEWTTRRDFCA